MTMTFVRYDLCMDGCSNIPPTDKLGNSDGARGDKCYAIVKYSCNRTCLNAYSAAPNKYSKSCSRSAIHRLGFSAYDKRLLLTGVSVTVTKRRVHRITNFVGAKCINRVVLFPSMVSTRENNKKP